LLIGLGGVATPLAVFKRALLRIGGAGGSTSATSSVFFVFFIILDDFFLGNAFLDILARHLLVFPSKIHDLLSLSTAHGVFLHHVLFLAVLLFAQ
jgi:hypothetical protein